MGYGITNTMSGGARGGKGCVVTNYADLLELRSKGKLKAGTDYRITDYVTTTSQTNTRSANHPFDVIVTADTPTTLNEVARCCLHEGDTYFAGCKMEAWEIKYCIDNDTTRFAWADQTNGKGVIYYMKDEYENEVPYDFHNIQFKRYEALSWYDWNDGKHYTLDWASVNLLNNFYLTDKFVVADFYDSSGYYARCTYDEATDTTTEVPEADARYEYKYTFNGKDEAGLNFDFSLKNVKVPKVEQGDDPWMMREQNRAANIHDNKIMPYYTSISLDDGEMRYVQSLNGNTFMVFLDRYNNGEYKWQALVAYNNTIKGGSYNNFLGNGCYNNVFGNDCARNILLGYCYNNSFGDNCLDNSMHIYANSNAMDTMCMHNVLYGYTYNNIIGVNCYNNVLKSAACANSFGPCCRQNRISGNSCSNLFGTACEGNIMGNSCQHNSFGDRSYYNRLGNFCNYNSFGDNAGNNRLGSFCEHNVFDAGASENILGNGQGENEVLYDYVHYMHYRANCAGTCMVCDNQIDDNEPIQRYDISHLGYGDLIIGGIYQEYNRKPFTVTRGQRATTIKVGLNSAGKTVYLNEFDTAHTHEIADVNGLQDALDGKAPITS